MAAFWLFCMFNFAGLNVFLREVDTEIHVDGKFKPTRAKKRRKEKSTVKSIVCESFVAIYQIELDVVGFAKQLCVLGVWRKLRINKFRLCEQWHSLSG